MGHVFQKNPTSRSSPFDKKLAAYTLAGAAALVPVAAHASGITYLPLDLSMTSPGEADFYFSGSAQPDIVIDATTGLYGNDPANIITVSTNDGAGVESFAGSPQQLLAGTPIGSVNSKWTSGSNLTISEYDTATNEPVDDFWAAGSQGYLGFYFEGSDGPQAGWLDLSLGPTDDSLELISLAFEDTPNTPFLAGQTVATPEPSTFALLALGAAGMMALRRRRAEAR